MVCTIIVSMRYAEIFVSLYKTFCTMLVSLCFDNNNYTISENYFNFQTINMTYSMRHAHNIMISDY